MPNGLGEHILGWTQLGDVNKYSGYYQKRLCQETSYSHTKAKRKCIKYIRCRPYWPRQNKTERWHEVHNNFANGVSAWHALSTEQKMYYNNLKQPFSQTGFTRFMSQYLKEHKV